MAPERRRKKLKEAGVTPTIQRLTILECLENSKDHPTADEVFARVHKIHPTLARATVYNALDALTQAGTIFRLTIDPSAARYDADLDPHIHFRCRLCGAVLDLPTHASEPMKNVDCHRVETVRTYAYGVCAGCLKDDPRQQKKRRKKEKPPSSEGKTTREEGA
jgi:Fur family peroxide stress response transcriptional regulator